MHPNFLISNHEREVIPISIGQNIRYLRLRRKLTQKDFGKKLNVSEAAISRWENDVCYPDITLLPEIANILGTNIDTIFYYKHEITNTLVK